MTRINITLPDELHKNLKIQAAMESVTIKDMIAQKLEEKLAKLEKKKGS